MRLFYLILISLCLTSLEGKAQLIFPQGKVNKLSTSSTDIYMETKIPFIYRGGKAKNLFYKKIYDSVPKAWTLMSCMSGNCILDLPDSGQFGNILSLPDTEGFYACHFLFNDTNGKGIVKYAVYRNSPQDSDAAVITLEVNYTHSSGVDDYKNNNWIRLYPNPSSGNTYLESNTNYAYSIYNTTGKEIYHSCDKIADKILLPELDKGVYFIHLKTRDVTKVYPLLRL